MWLCFSAASELAGKPRGIPTDAAQTSHTYEDYTRKMAALPADQLHYLGLALYGKKETVNRLTGSLPLLR